MKSLKIYQRIPSHDYIFQGIKLDEFNKLNFDMILMSPPCQPFTRQGNQNGSNDNRAQSFLSLIKIIPQ